jgi:hypothetical protein
MIRQPYLGLVAVGMGALLWAFVGFERLVGDHEVGVTWEPFLKHRGTLQVRFTNPSQQGLEIIPFEDLSNEEKTNFIQFCEIRYGLTDPKQCYARIAARSV